MARVSEVVIQRVRAMRLRDKQIQETIVVVMSSAMGPTSAPDFWVKLPLPLLWYRKLVHAPQLVALGTNGSTNRSLS
jgi:hypothetical protein